MEPLEHRLQEHPRPRRAEPRQRASRGPQPLGPPGAVHHRRRLPRPRQHLAAAAGRLGRRRGRRRSIARSRSCSASASRSRPAARPARRPSPRSRASRPAGLKPWREVVTPHPDVASGRYQQAEFAADLGQVHRGEGADEYRDPTEFFRRTFLTEGLRHLLTDALARLGRQGGRPGRRAADQLRRRQDPLDAGPLPPVLRHARRRPARASSRSLQAAGVVAAPEGPPRRAGRHGDLARPGAQEARRHGRPHPLGRAGLAAPGRRKATPWSPRPTGAASTPATRLRHAAPGGVALPDPDRRVGRLRPPALRRQRPARRLLRRQPDLRPGADRVGPRRAGRPGRRQLAVLATSRSAARADARRWTGSRTPSAGWSPPGGPPAPRRASRSSAAGCSSP